MKTLESSCRFDSSDVARFRLKVVEFGHTYGWKAVFDAFAVKRSTYFLWRQRFTRSQGKLTSLVPRSTRPKRVRQMLVDPRVVDFIKSVRERYGRVGKNKLHVLLAAYCAHLGIPAIAPSSIGKIIKRNRYFYEGKKLRRQRASVLRVRKAPKEKEPGYLEMDTVIIHVFGSHHAFITVIDVVTKYAACVHTTTPRSSKALELLKEVASSYPFPIRTIQTDNGSEFLGIFDTYCQEQAIPHVFTYPRSPRINGGIERFNRTIQEEFIERSEHLLEGSTTITHHLKKYLTWYNETRPHQALGYLSPKQYIQSLQSNM
jgi:transposase InsO family protein